MNIEDRCTGDCTQSNISTCVHALLHRIQDHVLVHVTAYCLALCFQIKLLLEDNSPVFVGHFQESGRLSANKPAHVSFTAVLTTNCDNQHNYCLTSVTDDPHARQVPSLPLVPAAASSSTGRVELSTPARRQTKEEESAPAVDCFGRIS